MKNGENLIDPHYREILKILYETGEVKRDEIYCRLSGSSTTKKKRLDSLIEMEYVEETKRGLHNTKMIRLTNEGELICRLIIGLSNGSVGLLEDLPTQGEKA